MIRFLFLLVNSPVLLLGFLFAHCSVLFGNILPSEKKAVGEYMVVHLSTHNADWILLPPINLGKGELGTEIPDQVYQSRQTAAQIAITSVCSERFSEQSPTLEELLKRLLLGFQGVTVQAQKIRLFQKKKGLETTLEGTLDKKKIKIKAIVLKHKNCAYDLTLVATPETFSQHEKDFEVFSSSLQWSQEPSNQLESS